MLLVGAASGLWTAWVEKRYVGAEGAAWSMTVAEHVVLAGRILVFYVAKLLWPHPLIPIYPRWTIDAGAWQQWLYPIGCVIILGCLFVWRKRLGRGPLAAAIFFIGTLFPALGLFNVYFMRFSFVADHFQYLASIGVIAAVAAWLSNVQRRLLRVVQAAVLVLLGVNTWAQATTYVSAQTVWSDTLAKNPRAWLAHNNLGVLLEREGQIDEAETHFRAALALEHDLAKVHGNLGSLLADRGDLDAGLHHFQEAIRLAPDSFDARFNFATALLRHGQWRRAADEYRRAIRVRRGDPEAHVGLARALLELGDREGAIHQLRECLRLQPDHDAARILSELDDP
jgi:Tfp pilus assembly protein PilF